MSTYVILCKVSPEAFRKPEELKKQADTVAAKIESECPKVNWKESYATLGRFDTVNIIESDDPGQVERAAMIIRAYGHSSTETMAATPWKEFIAKL